MHDMPPADHVNPDPRAQVHTMGVAFDRAWSESMQGAVCTDASVVSAVLFEIGAWRPWLVEAAGLLSPAERERVGRKQRPSDREELSLAYALHRLAAGAALQCDPAALVLDRDALGRPFVAGHEVHTSLSHTCGAVAVALSRQGFVGIDIEPATRLKELPEIAASVLHASEAGMLATLSLAARAEALLALWVRKEALLKASGIGLMREMHTFTAPVGRAIGLPAADGSEGEAAIIAMLETGPEWLAAIATLPTARVSATWLYPHRAVAVLKA